MSLYKWIEPTLRYKAAVRGVPIITVVVDEIRKHGSVQAAAAANKRSVEAFKYHLKKANIAEVTETEIVYRDGRREVA